MARLTPIHWKRLERVFLAVGFVFARQWGVTAHIHASSGRLRIAGLAGGESCVKVHLALAQAARLPDRNRHHTEGK
jgi:hypothetical protein